MSLCAATLAPRAAEHQGRRQQRQQQAHEQARRAAAESGRTKRCFSRPGLGPASQRSRRIRQDFHRNRQHFRRSTAYTDLRIPYEGASLGLR